MNKKIITLTLAVLMVLALVPVKPIMAGGAYNWTIIYSGQAIATGSAPTNVATKNNAQAYYNSKLAKDYEVIYKYDAGWFYYLYVDKKSEPLWTGSVSVEDGIGLDVPEGKKDTVTDIITKWIDEQNFDSRVYTVSDAKIDNNKHTIKVEVKKINDWWSWSIVCPDNSTGDAGYNKGYDVAYDKAVQAASAYKGAKIADIKVFDDQKYIQVKLTTNTGLDGIWNLNLYINDELKYNFTARLDACTDYARYMMDEYSVANNAAVKLREITYDYKNAIVRIYYAALKDPVGEVNFFFNDKLTGFVYDGMDFLDTYKFNFDDKVRLGDLLEEIDYMVEHGVYIDDVKIDKYSYQYENWKLRVDFEKELKNVPNTVKYYVTINVDGKKFDLGSMSAEELNDFVNKYNVPEYYKVYKSGDLFLSSLSSESFDIYEVEFRFELQRYAADTFFLQNHDWRIKQGFNVWRTVADKVIDGTNAVIISEQ